MEPNSFTQDSEPRWRADRRRFFAKFALMLGVLFAFLAICEFAARQYHPRVHCDVRVLTQLENKVKQRAASARTMIVGTSRSIMLLRDDPETINLSVEAIDATYMTALYERFVGQFPRLDTVLIELSFGTPGLNASSLWQHDAAMLWYALDIPPKNASAFDRLMMRSMFYENQRVFAKGLLSEFLRDSAQPPRCWDPDVVMAGKSKPERVSAQSVAIGLVQQRCRNPACEPNFSEFAAMIRSALARGLGVGLFLPPLQPGLQGLLPSHVIEDLTGFRQRLMSEFPDLILLDYSTGVVSSEFRDPVHVNLRGAKVWSSVVKKSLQEMREI